MLKKTHRSIIVKEYMFFKVLILKCYIAFNLVNLCEFADCRDWKKNRIGNKGWKAHSETSTTWYNLFRQFSYISFAYMFRHTWNQVLYKCWWCYHIWRNYKYFLHLVSAGDWSAAKNTWSQTCHCYICYHLFVSDIWKNLKTL